MKKIFILSAVLIISFGFLHGQERESLYSSYAAHGTVILSQLPSYENIIAVQRELEYAISNSVDVFGNLYIRAWSTLPSVLTFVNSDGSVTICSSDENTKITYVYEYNQNLREIKSFSFKNELGSLGAFTKDNDGNYYFFYGARASGRSDVNMAVIKLDRDGEKTNTYRLPANTPNSFNGIRVPFDAGTCRLELSGSMLAVYYAREMFDGHQASFGFVLDRNTFERIDTGAATNANLVGRNTQMPYVSHSFNQFILPAENGFIFADHGDAYPRSFTFARFQRGSDTRRLHAFTFPGRIGDNPTYAQMGGLAKTPAGYIFTGTYGRIQNNPRNLFVLTFDENMARCSNPVYLTNYTRDNGHAGHPKIVSVGEGHYLLLWEQFTFSAQGANVITRSQTGYKSTFALVINENGEAVSAVREFGGIRLNMNDTLRYNPQNGRVYWAINGSDTSIIIYSLDVRSIF
ncbi:MAG: hypothetical protein FWD40_10390 [Treponema sp.]|nr:hypothetical protein [Treponema sp.]